MDIRNLKPKTRELTIVLPTGEPTDIVLTVVGADSKQFRETSLKWATKYFDGDKKTNPADILHSRCEQAAACIVGWKGLEEDGVPIPYSPEKALELMMMAELHFVVDQIEQFITERANFFRRSEDMSK